jgi:hypothetical protein
MSGMTSRAPQFERVPGPTPLIITPRDQRILRHVRRHRFLNSEQILRLIGGSRAAVLRRLHLLFHHGYLDRPKAQIRHFEPKLNRPLVYALAKKGTRHLYDLGEVESLRIYEKRVGEIYLAIHHSRAVQKASQISFLGKRWDIAPTNAKTVTIVEHPDRFRVIAAPPTPHAPRWPDILADYRI